MSAFLRKPVLGTGFTHGSAALVLAIAPAFWAVFDLILVVTP
ncbi:hypothetical protein SPHINGOT1_80156 [Sphingomonas sp. T1]|nr:hypothetical protein [Sphingomonas sp. T1]VXD07585.1 hypothetical protein SPHINGOT1_80156 [Sphingomonas sp. T1]